MNTTHTADPSITLAADHENDHDLAVTDPAEEAVERLFGSLLGAVEALTLHVGIELGLYAALRSRPLTESELVAAAGIDQRYAREWLEQQAAAGVLTVADPLDDAARQYRLPDAWARVLLDPDDPMFLGTGPLCLVGLAERVGDVVNAYRTGQGVSFADYGRAIRDGLGGFNRPGFTNYLASSWMPTLAGTHSRLSTSPSRILDLGCGTGQSTMALARCYPQAHVVGIDLDRASLDSATEAARREGLGDRITFMQQDAARLAVDHRFDLITVFEALHDMADPVDALRAMRALLAEDGAIMIADERVADAFASPADEVERFTFSWSVLHCLPATRAEDGHHAHGAVLRTPTLRQWAAEAGCSVEVLDIDHDFWRFYRVTPVQPT